MLHPVTQRHFEAVRRRYPDAQLEPLPSGAALFTIPDFKLPPGWSAISTCVRFIVPVGYPGPFPDCFWASSGLRLTNGQMPQATQDPHQIPETALHGLWFSWHVTDAHANWNPNRDDLNTWIGAIAERFRRAQ
jgi:hypothetical protein